MTSLNARAALVSVLMLLVLLIAWEVSNKAPVQSDGASEFEQLMGGAEPQSNVPPPSEVLRRAAEELGNPFYDAGPNDKGIGIQLAYSLYRVLTGYFAAALIAIPLGFVIGMSPLMHKALNPFVQVLRPISPLAW